MNKKIYNQLNSVLRFVKTTRIKPFPGWPEISIWQNEKYSKSISWPKLSIITPSYNQASYLEQTILSVINQGYPNLEYIIIDGGSSDESVEIIEKYEKHLHYWETNNDLGQSHAINKGMSHATGEWVAWINSDDYYLPNAFRKIMQYEIKHSDVNWIVGNTIAMENMFRSLSTIIRFKPRTKKETWSYPKFQLGTWLDFVCNRWASSFLPQPSSFWRRKVWQGAGGLDNDFHFIMDLEFHGRLAYYGYRPELLGEDLAIFRRHNDQKTKNFKQRTIEEIQVIDKWLSCSLIPEEKSVLSQYKDWIMDNPL